MENKVKKENKIKAKGFTLIELLISMSIGLVLFAGLISVFIGMRTTTTETSSYGELQENGRFAISLLTDDILKQSFFGDFSGTLYFPSNLISVPAAPANDCVGGGTNNATFPTNALPFRTLWGQTIGADELNPLNCFSSPAGTSAMVGSDVIQFKRVIANPIMPGGEQVGRFYLNSNTNIAGIYAQGAVAPVINNARLWEYQHHVYYVRNRVVGDESVPVLMQGQLINLGMSFAPVIEGIERIRFMYGIDTDVSPELPGYGIVNTYVSADNMAQGFWDNATGARILSIKMYVLVRGAIPDRQYTNTNTYNLGDASFSVNDNFRRLLFSSTVTLYNNNIDSWQ